MKKIQNSRFWIGPIIHGAHPPQDSPICTFRSRVFPFPHNIFFSLTMSMSRRCRNVCLFGTSADPPTGAGGHVGIVQALTLLRSPVAQQQDNDDGVGGFAFDEIRVLPVYRHTYADKRQRLETFEHRYNMCWAAFGELPRVTVSDSEYKSWLAAVQDVPPEKRDQVSVGTAALIEYLNKNKNKQDDTEDEEVDVEEVYSFVMGADTFLDLTAGKWKESARVLDLLQGRLVVLEREQLNANSTAGASTGDDNAAATDTADNVALKKAVDAVPGARLLRVDNLNHISSSQVRACPSVVEIREQNMVVPAVLEYMRQHGLYAAFGGDKTE